MIKISPYWRFYVQLYRGLGRRLLLGLLLSILQPILLLPIPLMVQQIFERAIPNADYLLLVELGALALLLYVFDAAVALAARYVSLLTNKLAIMRLRADLLANAYRMSREYYSHADLALLHASLVWDTERLDEMSNAFASPLAPGLLVALVLGAALFYINVWLALILVVLAPLVILPGSRLGRLVRVETARFQETLSDFSRGVLFVLEMMELTRTQTAEAPELARQHGYLDKLRGVGVRVFWLQSAYGVLQNARLAIAGILVLIGGAALIASGALTTGGLLSFYVVIVLLSSYGNAIASTVPALISGQVALKKVYALATQSDREPYSGSRPVTLDQPILFDAVSFAYEGQPILHEVCLAIAPGQIVALVGPNGAGKSTLVNLLLGFYRPQGGALFVGDRPYESLDIHSLRRQVGLVSQAPLLFPASVYENLTYGLPDATREEVERAAALATADGFIRELPHGYATPVGERGALLSGGQRQRLAIARALLRRPALLILDEPTNHLDDAAVETLLGNLAALEGHPAILLISHDPRVARLAQRVYRLASGRILPAPDGAQPVLTEAARPEPAEARHD